MVQISRSVYTSLAARYWDTRLSAPENRARYGADASTEGLGGNWRIEITGPASERQLDAILARIKTLLDHRCLFTDLPEFTERASTPESVTAFLAGKFLCAPVASLAVHESDRLACVADADGFTLRLKVNNLTLSFRGAPDEFGLMTSREQVTQSVINALGAFASGSGLNEADWGRALLQHLRKDLPQLSSLRVDLRPGKYIVVE